MIEEETKEVRQQQKVQQQERLIITDSQTLRSSSLGTVPSAISPDTRYTHYVFFAANPRSGDQKANEFLNKARNIQCRFDDYGKHAYGHVFSVLDVDDSKRSYKMIAKTVESFSQRATIVVALMGGDGGIMRAIQVLEPICDIGKVVFVALPFGSGNDMAQTLKWGADTSMRYLRDLRTIMKEIVLNTKVTKVNIWETILTLRKKGDVLMVGSDMREKTVFNKQQQNRIKKGHYAHTCYMVNYFSMGDCAKIGWEFEMKRTRSKCGNVCMYVCSGMKRVCCGCCWSEQERVPLNEQIKYARAGSDIDKILDKQKAEQAEGKPPKRDSIFSKFRGSTKTLERRQSQMSLHFKQRMTTPRMNKASATHGSKALLATAPDMQQSVSHVVLGNTDDFDGSQGKLIKDEYDPLMTEVLLHNQEAATAGEGTEEDVLSVRTQDVTQQIIFATDQTSANADYYLRGDPVSLIITNIPSFKGGRANPWMEADNKIALIDAHRQSIKRADMESQFVEQSVSDGLLEISVASNLRNLILDKSRRLAQAGGPFELKFSDDDTSDDFIHFIQVDGEFMKVKNLASLTFRLASNLPEGSLNMLERNTAANEEFKM